MNKKNRSQTHLTQSNRLESGLNDSAGLDSFVNPVVISDNQAITPSLSGIALAIQMFRKFFPVVIPVRAICFLSCTENRRRNSITKIVKELTGKEIRFPEGLTCTSMGRDTTCIDLYSDSYKILLYVDSAGCTSCRLKLSEWKKIMKESDSVFIRKPEFVIIFLEVWLLYIRIINGSETSARLSRVKPVGKGGDNVTV